MLPPLFYVTIRQAISSFREQAAAHTPHTSVSVPFRLAADRGPGQPLPHISTPITPRVHLPEEEIAFGPACWLWDYLR